MTDKSIEFIVRFKKPPDATTRDCKIYIEDAVGMWKSSLCPGGSDGAGGRLDRDPMFDLDSDTIRVTRYVRRRKQP
jgi:hypothetical protein